MNIGIIGAGFIGATLARLLAEAGHQVAIRNSRGPESLAEVIKKLGPGTSAMTVDDTASFGDVVVEAIPLDMGSLAQSKAKKPGAKIYNVDMTVNEAQALLGK